jgi:hypothetical protein
MKDILQEQSRLIETSLQGLHSRLDENEKIISWISSAVVENDQKIMRDKLGPSYWDSGRWLLHDYEKWMMRKDEVTFLLCGSCEECVPFLLAFVPWNLIPL